MSSPEITVRGVPDDQAAVMVTAIQAIINCVREQPLDLANLDAVVVTDNYDAEIGRISDEKCGQITCTNEKYARGIAQVINFRRPNGSFGMKVVMVSASAAGVIGEDEAARDLAIHLFHHEFCHVHDNNKHRECLPDYFLKHAYTGTDQHFGPLAELIWMEYFANRYSCSTATNDIVSLYATGLAEFVPMTERLVEEAVVTYQCHGSDLDTLIYTATRHIRALLMMAAYVQGYIAGFNTTLADFSKDLHQIIEGSYIWDTWRRIQNETEKMHTSYPNWSSPEVYDGLKQIVADFFAQMGLVFSESDENTVWVDVPVAPGKIERVTKRLDLS